MELSEIRAHFPSAGEHVFLNHAAVAPMSWDATRAMKEFLDDARDVPAGDQRELVGQASFEMAFADQAVDPVDPRGVCAYYLRAGGSVRLDFPGHCRRMSRIAPSS